MTTVIARVDTGHRESGQRSTVRLSPLNDGGRFERNATKIIELIYYFQRATDASCTQKLLYAKTKHFFSVFSRVIMAGLILWHCTVWYFCSPCMLQGGQQIVPTLDNVVMYTQSYWVTTHLIVRDDVQPNNHSNKLSTHVHSKKNAYNGPAFEFTRQK